MVIPDLPEYVRKEFPYSIQKLDLPKNGHKLSFIDEGQGEPILCVHGNPTWSYYFRSIVKNFSSSYRVICPDHLGCGTSDHPQDYPYDLSHHVENLNHLINKLQLKNITLVLHDWGGAIGLGCAVKNISNIKKVVLFNTAAFRSQMIPKRIAFFKTPILGEFLIRRFNMFARGAVYLAPNNHLKSHIKKSLLWPYNNYKNRVAVARFVQDIPLNPNHTSYNTLLHIENNLAKLNCPMLILWGLKDFCFHEKFLNKWLTLFPNAQVKTYADGGHYLLEDKPQEVSQQITQFLESSNEYSPTH